jgi:hypothetical protein
LLKCRQADCRELGMQSAICQSMQFWGKNCIDYNESSKYYRSDISIYFPQSGLDHFFLR